MRTPYAPISRFGRDLPREVTEMERRLDGKLRADDAAAWGFRRFVTPAVTGTFTAHPWDLVFYDPSGGGVRIVLPHARDTRGSVVAIKNVTASTTAVSVTAISGLVDLLETRTPGGGLLSMAWVSDGQHWWRIVP